MTYPLLRTPGLSSAFAWRGGQTIPVARFLGDVAALAARLPVHAHVINLCSDRYRFVVGFAAAMIRRQISLLPPSDAPGVLAHLKEDYPDLYCLTDGKPVTPIDTFLYPDALPGDESMDIPDVPADQIACLLFTSGSTGKPKPQVKRWGAMVASTWAAGNRLNLAGLSGATLVGTVPHQHSYGLESTVMLALQHGLMIHAQRPLLPADISNCLETIPGKKILVTAPIHLRTLLASGETLPKARFILSATAPLSPQLALHAEARFDAPLYEIYGCSEAGQIATRRTAVTAQWECLEAITLRQDERGTWACGQAVGPDTLLNDEIEVIDPARFSLHGRLSDVINVAGKRSSLAYLNYHLNAIPGVQDGIFLMPDNEHPNARPIAFVVAPSLTKAEIVSALRQHVDAAFLPRPLHLVAELPRNDLGKLSREQTERLLAKVESR